MSEKARVRWTLNKTAPQLRGKCKVLEDDIKFTFSRGLGELDLHLSFEMSACTPTQPRAGRTQQASAQREAVEEKQLQQELRVHQPLISFNIKNVITKNAKNCQSHCRLGQVWSLRADVEKQMILGENRTTRMQRRGWKGDWGCIWLRREA